MTHHENDKETHRPGEADAGCSLADAEANIRRSLRAAGPIPEGEPYGAEWRAVEQWGETHKALVENQIDGYDELPTGQCYSEGLVTTDLQGHPMAIICAACGEALTPVQSGSPCPKCGSLDRDCAAWENGVAADKAEVAKELARKHYQIESGITQILRFTQRLDVEVIQTEPIKLLEVNENTVPAGVMPLYFGPAPASGIPYPSVIVEVTPDEYQKIQSHELKLPAGWDHGEILSKPSLCNGRT